MEYSVGVDIGGTNVRVALGAKGRILSRLVEHTNKGSGPEGISNQIIRMVKQLGVKHIVSVGIASAGPLDIGDGAIVHSPNIGFEYIPLVKPLKKALDVPIYLANDCVAGVVGEKKFGYGKRCKNLVYVTISSGIGGGVFVDDHLLLGKDGNAHEIGHLTIDYTGRLKCGCGKRGHWEAYCGGANISNFIKLQLESRSHSEVEGSILYKASGGNLDRITSKTIFESAMKGDGLSIEIIKEMGRLNAIGFANITNAYDPELITVGGAIALANPDLVINFIRQHISDYSINMVPEINITGLGEDIVLYGALTLHEYLSYRG